MKFDEKYFSRFKFNKEQISNNLKNAIKDLNIAKKDKIPEVKFNYAYTALLKAGIALISFHKKKMKSIPGHHVMIIESLAQILHDEVISDLGNLMRSKRNIDLYGGGIEVTEKECKEYIGFVEKVIARVEETIR